MRFSQSATSLFVFAGLCSALPMNPMIKRQDAITGTVGTVVNGAGLGSVYSEVESLAGSAKRQASVAEIESLVNDTGLGSVAPAVESLKRDDPASSVLTAIEGLFGRSAKRQDPVSTVAGAVTTLEADLSGLGKRQLTAVGDALDKAGLAPVVNLVDTLPIKRQDPVSSVEGVATTLEADLSGLGTRQLTAVGDALDKAGLSSVVNLVDTVPIKRQDPVSTVEGVVTTLEADLSGAGKRQLTAVGDALDKAGLSSVVNVVDTLPIKRQDPVSTIESVATELSQIAARDADDC